MLRGRGLRRLIRPGVTQTQMGLVGGAVRWGALSRGEAPLQVRMFSLGSLNPFAKKEDISEAATTTTTTPTPTTTTTTSTSATTLEELEKQELEDLQNIIRDDASQYEEPELTFFEQVDGLWDTVLDVVSPFRWINRGLYGLHDLGFEWWMCIVLVSSTIRFALLPVQLIASRNAIRMSQYTTELGVLKQQKQSALQNSTLTDKERALVKNNYDARIKAVCEKGGFKEWLSFLSLAAVVPFGLVFYCVRRLIMDEPGVKEGGFLWFKDLSAADPSGALICIAYVLIVTGTEMTLSQSMPTKSKYYVLQRWGGRCMGAVGMYIFAGNSAGVLLGFVVSAVWGIMPPLLLRSGAFRRYFQIPSIQQAPRSNMEIQKTGWNGVKSKVRTWMQGASVEKTSVLGGGIGRIAHTTTGAVRSVADFKVVKKSAKSVRSAGDISGVKKI
eukprot:TRINITY_DN110_c2_g1_i2.p1 TRINITY_DN110_c2_g1~~TRINITY_DN110_c2_g1_i2.p1  ORF type:complete len:442 (+),score=75.08 TRINITY_DN110_c2_g1_i2:49-1374(+)